MPKRKYASGKTSAAKRRRFSTRRKVYARRRSMPSYRSVVPRGVMPRVLKKKMQYFEKISINAGLGGTPSSWFFSCNSLYDPNRTGTGHQPMGFDQLMPFFDHYVVIGSKITIKCMSSQSTSGGANSLVGIRLRDGAIATTNMTQALENGNMTYGLLGTQDSARSSLTLSKAVNPAKFLGRSKALADSQLKGSVSSNPAEECYFEVLSGSFGDDDPGSFDILVNITYVALFIEPKEMTQS